MIVRTGGGPRGGSPARRRSATFRFSPDSRKLGIALRDRLVVHDPARRRTIQIARGSGFRGFSFSPDSKSVVWARADRWAPSYDAPSDLLPAQPQRRRGAAADDATGARATRSGRGAGSCSTSRRPAARAAFPAWEIHELPWDGSDEQQLTDASVPIDDITYGLRPEALDADGVRLLAALVGQSRYDAYAVDLAEGGVRKLGADLVPGGISRDGSTLLLQTNGIEPDARHDIVTMPWDGGRTTVLVRNARTPTWSR